MSEPEKLEACPWCGGVATRCPTSQLSVACADEFCLGGGRWVSPDEWNTRYIESALRAEVAALKAEVERLRAGGPDACLVCAARAGKFAPASGSTSYFEVRTPTPQEPT